jgi:predicted glutamine amidotransferase
VSNGQVSLFSRLNSNAVELPPTLHYRNDEGSWIVASEPLSDSSEWKEADPGQVLVLEKESDLRFEQINV